MSMIGILKIMEVQEDDMEVQEEAILMDFFSETAHNETQTNNRQKKIQNKKSASSCVRGFEVELR